MIGTKYLSQLVDVSALQKGWLNVIKAPTGSGKTYFALEHIPSLIHDALHKVVFLIDTINGKEQILKNYNATCEYYEWSKEVDADGMWFEPNGNVVVLTYAKFGSLLTRYHDFYQHFSFIICDELHNLLKFQHFSKKPNLHSIAKNGLEQAVKQGNATVIALTATPNLIYKDFQANTKEIYIDQNELIQYEVKETVNYTTLDFVLSNIEVGSIGLCYMHRISQMKAFEELAKASGFSPICIWSISNSDHKMTDEQLCVRRSVLEDYIIPEQYDLLIINSSSETSLKIKSPVDYVIVHSSNPDTQIQVKGRVNGDLKTLYLPGEGVPVVRIPEQYLERKLFREDKNTLLTILDLRNSNNRRYGWTTVKDILIDNEYTITEGRSDNKRYVIITIPHDG